MPQFPDDTIEAFETFRRALTGFRGWLVTRRTELTSTVTFDRILAVHDQLANVWQQVEEIKGKPRLGSYVRRAYGNSTADVAAAAGTLQTSVTTAWTTVRNSMPLSADGYVLAFQPATAVSAVNQYVYRSVPPGQTATLRTNLDQIVADIDALMVELTG